MHARLIPARNPDQKVIDMSVLTFIKSFNMFQDYYYYNLTRSFSLSKTGPFTISTHKDG